MFEDRLKNKLKFTYDRGEKSLVGYYFEHKSIMKTWTFFSI